MLVLQRDSIEGRLTETRIGLLSFFGADLIKDGISEIVNGTEDWTCVNDRR